MNYILGGPCGVGKSTNAKLLSEYYGIVNLDFDTIRLDNMKKRRGERSPCSISFLDLEDCLKNILNSCQQGFVLDIGGSSIFRKDKDNQKRLDQILWLKGTFDAKVIVLFAKKSVVRQRFLATKNRKVDEFGTIWQAWKKIEKPYWQRCTDNFINTTGLAPKNILQLIVEL